MMKRVTVYVDEGTEEALADIRRRCAASNDSEAVRLAVRLVAASPIAQITPSPGTVEAVLEATAEEDPQ